MQLFIVSSAQIIHERMLLNSVQSYPTNYYGRIKVKLNNTDNNIDKKKHNKTVKLHLYAKNNLNEILSVINVICMHQEIFVLQ